MGYFFRDWLHPSVVVCLALILYFFPTSSLNADDCKRVSNILVLFDASGYMKEKDRYQLLLTQMGFFEKGMPVTADGFFNVGLRHYGLKVGMGCENTESILAVQQWDPEKFLNAFPKTVSYGVSFSVRGAEGSGRRLSLGHRKKHHISRRGRDRVLQS